MFNNNRELQILNYSNFDLHTKTTTIRSLYCSVEINQQGRK